METSEMQNIKALAFESLSLILIYCHEETHFIPWLGSIRVGATAFSGKRILMKIDWGCFCYCYCWTMILLSGRRKQAEPSSKEKYIWKEDRRGEQS